jgi:serine phosphatase RsbU (regulator of sigma subunit)
MLPGPVRHPSIDIDVRYVPLETIGGDYCQVLFPVDTCCYITLCDVEGHGIGPAILATRVSSEVHRLVHDQRPPHEIVKRVNQFVINHFVEAELFLTLFVAKIDLRLGMVTYSGAGHPGPLLIRNGSREVEILRSQNLMIGVRQNILAQCSSDQLRVFSGDRLVFFTDGLIETFNSDGKMLSSKEVLQIASHTCDGELFDAADDFLERIEAFRNGPPQDDLTLIIAELK